MVVIERVTPENVLRFKEVRLRALQDAPLAFGSTYRREAALPDAEWRQRAEKWNGKRSVLFLATDGSATCGMAGSHLHEQDGERAQLISMWTAASYRKQGIGRRLVGEVVEWARERQVRRLYLMVTSVNDGAMAFYERLGFAKTGRTEPYPNDPGIIEYEMVKEI
jgi:ribosomal protein S18 acetylase RimI-like enzyme